MAGTPLDSLPAPEIIDLMDKADRRALGAVVSARADIARAAGDAASRIKAGGRLIYVGAGTSGRLGVLDASECPPTFSAPPGQVVGVIAGGMKALTRAVEGAEDDSSAGKAAVTRLKVSPKDMLVGITASGTTPFVLAALEAAAAKGASTWLITCSDAGKRGIGRPLAASNVIFLDTGREVIQGSTRLAAGTATKLALNRISTAAFVLAGKVYGDLMVDVVPGNEKLIRRAAGIILKLTGCSEGEALALLKRSGGSAKVAVVMKKKGLGKRQAERLLKEKGGFLREALR